MLSISAKHKSYRFFLNIGATFLISILLGGCAWYSALGDQESVRESHISDSSMLNQDKDMKRFYELQQRIEQLEKKLDESKSTTAPRSQSNSGFYDVNKKAEQAISYIRKKTAESIGVINEFISTLKADQAQSVGEVQQAAKARGMERSIVKAPVVEKIKNGAVSGSLVRDKGGKVVKATTDGKKYNYSVVYIYPETKPWFDMWSLLESEGIQDKWRGKNVEKQTYFIYVGAYYTPRPAERRQNHLMTLTGAKPAIRIREGYQAVAMK